MAEDAWNSHDAGPMSFAYTPDTEWRNRDTFANGRGEVVGFLQLKWAKEHDYPLRKTLWAFTGYRIAVRFEYAWHDDAGQLVAQSRQRELGSATRTTTWRSVMPASTNNRSPGRTGNFAGSGESGIRRRWPKHATPSP